jgi:hypothetical protein
MARTAGFAAAAVLAAGCAVAGCNESTHVVRSTGPQRVYDVSVAGGAVAVRAGTEMVVRLDRDIGTETTTPGEAFTATVETPLVAAGQIVVPAGARVRGRVAALTEGRLPVILLDFRGLETVYGEVRPAVAVRTADRVVYRAEHGGMYVPSDATSRTMITGTSMDPGVATAQNTSGPWARSVDGPGLVVRPREVYLAPGARLRLVLTRPLVVARR